MLLSHLLEKSRLFCLAEFQRKPRTLDDLKFFKAKEYRSILLYLGAAIFRRVLSSKQYQLFLHLHVAYRILNNEYSITREENIEYARNLLRSYVPQYGKVFGPHHVSNIIHSLIHVADDVQCFRKSLMELSAYPFESRLGFLSKLTKSAHCPTTQIARRIHEMNKFDVCQEVKTGKLGPDKITGNDTFNTFHTEKYTFDNGLANRYCEINGNKIFVVSHFAKINNEKYVFAKEVKNLRD